MIDRRKFTLAAGAVAGSTVLPSKGLAQGVDLSGGQPASREYVLDERPAHDVRDAVNIWLEEENAAFGMRLGIEALSQEWDAHDVWLDIAFPDGRVLSRRGNGPTRSAIGADGKPSVREAGPVRFECVEPFRQWKASFKGEAAEITAAGLIANPDVEETIMRDVEFDAVLDMVVPPWSPGSMSADARAAMAGKQGEFMSPRYEQLYRASGLLRIADQTWRFSGTGLRIRRQGVRKFAGFPGHCWQSAVFPSGKGFGYIAYPSPEGGPPTYNEGYVYDGHGIMKPARAVQIPWMREMVTDGDAVPLVLETEDGQISIDATSYINLRSRGFSIATEFPIVQQSHVRYRWGDEEACGMMERSTLAANLRI